MTILWTLPYMIYDYSESNNIIFTQYFVYVLIILAIVDAFLCEMILIRIPPESYEQLRCISGDRS